MTAKFTQVVLLAFVACILHIVLSASISSASISEEKRDLISEEEDSQAEESFPLGFVAPPPYRPRPLRPRPLPLPDYGTSSSYHEQDYDGYGAYRFGYKVEDPYTGNYQTRDEDRDDYGAVKGSYSLVEPDGNVRTVYYVADKFGFRAYVKNTLKPSSSHGLPAPF